MTSLTRSPRGARRLGAVALAAALAAALSGCAADAATSGSDADGFGTAEIQLSWLKNQQFAGTYFADADGFFTDAGFDSVTLTAGGSGATSAEAAVTTGKALIGISAPLITAPAIAQGAEAKIVGTLYQRNPFSVVSSADAPLTSAADLVGKTIAVSDSNTLVWGAFLAANDLSDADVTTVPLSDTSMLTTGQVDGYLGYTTSGAAALTTSGFPAVEFLLADEGLPMLGESLIASQDAIDNDRERVVALLTALVRGWNAALEDPERAVELTVDVYGADQEYDPAAIALAVEAQTPLIVTDETEQNGILTISEELQQATVDSLALADIDIAADDLFDLSLLEDVYEENPDLR
ncbi:ABC transporter substrate-binding protein [Microbacterium sp. Marseille-Q6965]|uniref:ABC transporter substrate-binding protein n=1 Tax=Microbacterium sp. Marseille-Q6965 TaxID=2965072 RepID=UPI0021B79295|nr:ABC transporter substrate-binding protein [Microbacterium sp. Marseille-Q6965]